MLYYTLRLAEDKLKDRGVAFNRTLFKSFEESGIIPKPKNILIARRANTGISRIETRIYTEEEIDRLIEIYISHKPKTDEESPSQKSQT